MDSLSHIQHQPMFPLLLFAISTLSIFFFVSKFKRTRPGSEHHDPNISHAKTHQTHDPTPTHLTHSLLLQILPSNGARHDDPDITGSGLEDGIANSGPGDHGGKKRKKRGKKKSLNSFQYTEMDPGLELNPGQDSGSALYPFTTASSAMQRKIKLQYDQLVKCHESRGLTLAQVGQFAKCLIESRSEMQHKSEIIQRKFTITKALLLKADRSSFDRLCQQINKLEIEQKRLEEDASVYNWLQQQLKISPAYKKMLEIGACMELKAKSDELMESTDDDFTDISFEELLEQEKKDSFWQRNGKPRSCSSS